MKLLLVLILGVLSFATAFAGGEFNYSDKFVRVYVEWKKSDDSAFDLVTIKLRPSVDILVPVNAWCFKFDSLERRGSIRNHNCPDYTLMETGKYWFPVIKDSTVMNEWKIPSGKLMKAFFFDVRYIPRSTNDYKSKQREIEEYVLENKKVVLISFKNEVLLGFNAILDFTQGYDKEE